MGKARRVDLEEQLRRAVAAAVKETGQNQLARNAGVHQTVLSRFLRAERSITLRAAAKLCTHLGLRLGGAGLGGKE